MVSPLSNIAMTGFLTLKHHFDSVHWRVVEHIEFPFRGAHSMAFHSSREVHFDARIVQQTCMSLLALYCSGNNTSALLFQLFK